MIPAINRLKKEKDFERVFKKGKGFQESFLILRIAKNNLKDSRFGFIVAKSFSKKAVERNLIKRRLREAVRKRLKDISRSVDGVFIARPGLEKRKLDEIDKIVERLFKKAKLI